MAKRRIRHQSAGRTVHSQLVPAAKIFERTRGKKKSDKVEAPEKAEKAKRTGYAQTLTVKKIHVHDDPVTETVYTIGVFPGNFQLDLTTASDAAGDAYFSYVLVPVGSPWTLIGFFVPFELEATEQEHTLFISIPDDEIWPPLDQMQDVVLADFTVDLIRLSDHAVLATQGPFWLQKA